MAGVAEKTGHIFRFLGQPDTRVERHTSFDDTAVVLTGPPGRRASDEAREKKPG
jgi:hypothetical protein